ncbi:MAG: AAA family ATPase [Patescibacteria group bacterium]|jgi:dephospho-CoA kinase
MIIGLTGLPAAGKGTVAKYLVDRYKAKQIRFSDPLRDIAARLYVKPTREHLSHLGVFVRSEFGVDVLEQTLLKDIEKTSHPLYVLDGVRFLDEIEALSKRPDFSLWALDTTFEKRYERIIKRGENSGEKLLSKEQFEAHQNLETERSIPDVMKKAAVLIDNNGTIDELYKKVDEYITNLQR